ncbi:TetR/AcrR family transcriptional regulator [Nostocoides sp. HKS02]|uniref:TetR/AcrR family transcriptional regulator n=1 Tax=Nostocoides sp. HKS02 TaxID=1813880 RepID=UPI0012B4912A|nr:TetR/AcrR family transcriptional regulator [Tetrasphaera sp. HKS02]QGN58502.1 TetR family transcriptional regulator [Tetrasphaera sp. HKS02]
MGGPVKAQRDYDSSRRRDAASARRARVLEAARTLFLDVGFARATVAAIADQAGVSQETVYKSFGGKTGLVEALYRQGLEGEGPVPAYQRSDELRGTADPSTVLYGWSRLSMEVAPRVSPIWLMVRDAAVVDPALGVLLREMDDDRYRRMTENARFLADAGHLGAGVDVQAAADLMWSVTAPEMFELLVLRRGWSVERWADSIYATISGLLRPR